MNSEILEKSLTSVEPYLRADEHGRFTAVVKVTLDEIFAAYSGNFLAEKVSVWVEIVDYLVVGYEGNELHLQVTCELVDPPDPFDWSIDDCQRFLDKKLGIDCNLIDWVTDDDVTGWREEVCRRLEEIEEVE